MPIKLQSRTLVFLLVLLMGCLWSSFGQTFTGDIVGTVTDQQGSVIPGVEVTLRNQETNATRIAVTSELGRYVFARLSPGTYEVTAELTGFKRSVISDINLQVGTRRTVEIELEVGEIATEVQVVAGGVQAQTEDVTLGQVMTGDVIVELPLNGRNFLELAQLSPGVMQIHTAISPVSSWTSRSDMSVVVAGLRETDTSYLLDGIETRSPRWGGSGFRPSIDVIREFNVQRNAFTADQGWGTTVVNTVIDSGSNEFHGTAFHFIRNDALDARNFFDSGEKPEFKQNQFGGTFGGPIVKDSVFFFASYEGFRQRLGQTFQANVPSQGILAGQFDSEVIDPTTGEPFANNMIPQNRVDEVISNVIPFYPAPNRPEDPSLNFVRSASRINDRDEVHAKVDFIFDDKNTAFVRFSWVDEPLFVPSTFEGFGLNRPLGDYNIAGTWTHFFSPNLVNEFRVGYNWNKNDSLPEAAFGDTNLPEQIGLENTSDNPANWALPNFGPIGFSSIGQGFGQTQVTRDNLFQFNENLSWTTGNHTIRLGGDIRPRNFEITNDFPSAPFFNFDGFYTGQAMGDFLLGIFSFTQKFIGDSTADFSNTDFAVFVQDDWKVHPKLNLNFGLRYEYFDPMSEAQNKLNYLDFGTLDFVQVDGPLFEPDRNNFAPRVGFAYSPFEDGRTVIRGGFGVFYDLIAFNETQFWGVLNPPSSQITSISNTRPDPTFFVENMFPDPAFDPSTAPNTTDPFNRQPYVYQYNFNVQRELTENTLLEVGWVGSTGHKLNRRFNSNLAVPDPDRPIQERRPFQGFDDILTSLNNGWSNYNGLNARLERRFTGGLSYLISYTLGKHLDIGGPDEYVHRDVTGTLKELRGPASLDSRQRFVGSFTYELPFGRGKSIGSDVEGVADALVSGWQFTGIATFMSGQAKTPVIGGDWAQIGGRRLQPPNRVGEGNSDELKDSIRDKPTLFPYFNVDDFVIPERGLVGDGGRGIIIGPGVNNWDLSLQKYFGLTENLDMQFRAEFFNAFNHAQFAGLGLSARDPNFGRITSARSPRSIQFGFKFIF